MHRKTGRYTEISKFWIWEHLPVGFTGKSRKTGRFTVSGEHRKIPVKRKREPWVGLGPAELELELERAAAGGSNPSVLK